MLSVVKVLGEPKGRSQMEKMAGVARFGRESHDARGHAALMAFIFAAFHGKPVASNHLPFTVAAWPGAFHRFYNPLRVIDGADAAPPTAHMRVPYAAAQKDCHG